MCKLKDLCEDCAFKNKCKKYKENKLLKSKLEIAVKALEKMVNYNSVAEQVDKYYYIVLDVREIGKKALKEIRE